MQSMKHGQRRDVSLHRQDASKEEEEEEEEVTLPAESPLTIVVLTTVTR